MHASQVQERISLWVRARGHTTVTTTTEHPPAYELIDSESRRTWLIFDSTLCAQILRDSTYEPTPLKEFIDQVGRCHGADFKNLYEFLDSNPITQSGLRHREIRKPYTQHFRQSTHATDEYVQTVARQHWEAVARSQSPLKVSSDLVAFFVDQILLRLTALDSDESCAAFKGLMGTGGLFFNYAPDRRKLQHAEQALALFNDCNQQDENRLMNLSFVLQGRDPLVGTLSAWLASIAALDPTQRTCAIHFAEPASIIEQAAAVNYVTRLATETSKLGDGVVQPNDFIILFLFWANSREPQNASSGLAFGAGAHVCAGRALALAITKAWLDQLKKVENRINWGLVQQQAKQPGVFQSYGKFNVRS